MTLIQRLFVVIALTLCIGCEKSSPSDEIKIGAIASLIGPASEQGKNWAHGAELAVDDANSQGIHAKLILEDDQTEPAKVISAFTKLVQIDGVKGIVGGTWDYLGEAAYPLAKRFHIPFITPTNPVEVLSPEATANPYVFSNSMTLAAMSAALERFLERENIKKLGLVYPNLPFGTQQAMVVETLAKAKGIEITYRYEFPYSAAMSDNVRLAALKLNEIRPDATFAVLDYNGLDLLTTEFSKLKYYPKVITTQHLDQAFLFSKDPPRYRSMYAIYPKVQNSEFKEKYLKRFKESPKVYAEHGYDAAMFLIQAIHKGIDISNSHSEFEYDGLTGKHTLTSFSRGLVNSDAVVMTTRNGAFEELY